MGAGYEKTDPDYDDKRIARMKKELAELEPRWRKTFLEGLSKEDRWLVTREAA